MACFYCVIFLPELGKIENAGLCEGSFGKNHALYVHLTYEEVDHFQNGTVHELSCLKACQISNVQAHFYEMVLTRGIQSMESRIDDNRYQSIPININQSIDIDNR